MAGRRISNPVAGTAVEAEISSCSAAFDFEGLENGLADSLRRAAKLLRPADAVLVVAGAGMGVDSGLDAFRNADGTYTEEDYAHMTRHGIFLENPQAGWSFHGAALQRFRAAVPHHGFAHLLRICQAKLSYYVVTSNVDGHFESEGFGDRVFNAHGSVHLWQCTSVACNEVRAPYPAGDWRPGVVPKCPCGMTARPCVSFFDEMEAETFNGRVVLQQFEAFESWLAQLRRNKRKLCIIEIGCGASDHSLRLVPKPRGRWSCASEEWGLDPLAATLIRIDPLSDDVAPEKQHNFVHVRTGALEALCWLESLMVRKAKGKAA